MSAKSEMEIFHNRLCIMMSIDMHELVNAGVIGVADRDGWDLFSRNPWRWFISVSTEKAERVWLIIKRREGRA